MNETAAAVEQMRQRAERDLGPAIDRIIDSFVKSLIPSLEQWGKELKEQREIEYRKLGLE